MITREEVEVIITRLSHAWNTESVNERLWVIGATPGDWVSIPKFAKFQSNEKPTVGVSIPLRGFLIILDRGMSPEGLLTTFFHELGHVKYRQTHGDGLDPSESEMWAVRFCLETLEKLGRVDLAYREADAIKKMASDEPYRSAVELLKNEPIWLKFSRSA